MNTNTAPQAPHPNVIETVRVLTNLLLVRNCRLANEESNWVWVTGTIIASGHNPMTEPPAQLAQIVLEKLNATLLTNGLKWDIPPAALQRAQSSAPAKHANLAYADRDATARKAKQTAEEAIIAKNKEEAATLADIRSKIVNFVLFDVRRGRPYLSESERLRKHYLDYVDEQVARGVAPSAIAVKVIENMNQWHEAVEKAAERSR